MKTTEELYRIQEKIASKAVIEDKLTPNLKLIAGADQAFFHEYNAENKSTDEKIISAIVVLEYPSMKLITYTHSVLPVKFPYIPGLLSFREAPAILKAFHTLKIKPDLLVIDGCGINHPRFAGLATYVGVILNVATIGVTKNILCGNSEQRPCEEGDACMMKYNGREIAYYLKSKDGCRPIIVAPGHKITLETSLSLIKTSIRKHKLPEPTRIAHLCANKIKNSY